MGMGIKSLKWEGFGTKSSHTSLDQVRVAVTIAGMYDNLQFTCIMVSLNECLDNYVR